MLNIIMIIIFIDYFFALDKLVLIFSILFCLELFGHSCHNETENELYPME